MPAIVIHPSVRRWGRLLVGVLIITTVALLIAGPIADAIVRSRLRSLVRDSLNAELTGGRISYRPWLGAVVQDAAIVRTGAHGERLEIARVERLEVSLASLPRKGQPIVIKKISARRLAIHWPLPGAPPPSSSTPPQQVAEDVEKVRILQAQLVDCSFYCDDGDQPGALGFAIPSINVELGPPAAPGNAQQLTVAVHAPDCAIDAAGTLWLHDGRIGLDRLSAAIRVGTAPGRDFLPQPVRKLVDQYGLAGEITLTGSGQLPLNDLKQITFTGDMAVRDAHGRVPVSNEPVTVAAAMFSCDGGADSAGPAGQSPRFRVKVSGVDASGFGENVHVDAGQVWLDPASGRWGVDKLRGSAEGNIGSATTPPQATQPASAPGAMPPMMHPILSGRMDFTAGAEGPIHLPADEVASKAIHYEALVFPRELAFWPGAFPRPIERINAGSFRVANGIAKLEAVSGAYGGDAAFIQTRVFRCRTSSAISGIAN